MTDDFDPDDEDRKLLERWLAGPGARPTKAERERWMKMARALLAPVYAEAPEDDA